MTSTSRSKMICFLFSTVGFSICVAGRVWSWLEIYIWQVIFLSFSFLIVLKWLSKSLANGRKLLGKPTDVWAVGAITAVPAQAPFWSSSFSSSFLKEPHLVNKSNLCFLWSSRNLTNIIIFFHNSLMMCHSCFFPKIFWNEKKIMIILKLHLGLVFIFVSHQIVWWC